MKTVDLAAIALRVVMFFNRFFPVRSGSNTWTSFEPAVYFQNRLKGIRDFDFDHTVTIVVSPLHISEILSTQMR